MKQQILVIHGGSVSKNYKEYIDFLKTKELRIEKLKGSTAWKDNLGKDLGNNYEVFVPTMPNRENAKYKEWKIWFERIIPLLNDDLILIGHSLGGIFLAKYLSTNILPKKIKAVYLVAAPFHDSFHDSFQDPSKGDLANFKLPKSLSKFSNQVCGIILIQGNDDPLVPNADVHKYKNKLPNAKLYMFEDKGHFRQKHFPELVDMIKT